MCVRVKHIQPVTGPQGHEWGTSAHIEAVGRPRVRAGGGYPLTHPNNI